MMSLPLILLSGQAGSGKDTVASFLVKNHKAAIVSFADPMKRFAKMVFEFSDDQLWGPSSSRNGIDPRFLDKKYRDDCVDVVKRLGADFISQWLPGYKPSKSPLDPHTRMISWVWGVFETVELDGGLSPRKALQTFGTEWGRSVDSNIWVNYTLGIAKKLLSGGYRYGRSTGLQANFIVSPPDYVVISDGRFRNEIVEVLSVGGSVWKIESPELDTLVVERAGVAGHKSESEQKTIPDHFYSIIFHNDKSKGLEYLENEVNVTMELWTFPWPTYIGRSSPKVYKAEFQ